MVLHFIPVIIVTSYSQGRRFFINEFDESIDEIILDVVEAIASDKEPIEFWINSDGGDTTRAFSLVALINRAKVKGVPVHTFILHTANSSASMVSVAGTRRYIAPAATLLVHYGEVDTVVRGPVEIERAMQSTMAHFNLMRNHYLDHTRIPLVALDEYLTHDLGEITAKQAIDWGFADEYL